MNKSWRMRWKIKLLHTDALGAKSEKSKPLRRPAFFGWEDIIKTDVKKWVLKLWT